MKEIEFESYQNVLRKVQLTQLNTLICFDTICKKYNINYWADYGTLLGIIRHKGFIPWDDDLDLGMMREDFDKLMLVPSEEWGDSLLFCGPSDGNEIHDKFFGRVYNKNSRIQSIEDIENWHRWSDNKPFYTSLMCDIFIFDFVPERHEEYMTIRRKCDRVNELYKITKLRPWTTSKSILKILKTLIKLMLSVFFRFIWKTPWTILDIKLKEIIKKESKGTYIGAYVAGAASGRLTCPYNEIFPLREGEFEGMTIPIPNDSDSRLKAVYGDYMKFPPEEERHHIKPVFLDLGDGVEHVFQNVPGSLGWHE